MANYVHMSVLILPKIAVLFYMGYVNGKCTLIIFDKHANYNVNDTLRMYKNDDIRMYNFNCITDTIVEVITTCNTYTLLTVHLL